MPTLLFSGVVPKWATSRATVNDDDVLSQTRATLTPREDDWYWHKSLSSNFEYVFVSLLFHAASWIIIINLNSRSKLLVGNHRLARTIVSALSSTTTAATTVAPNASSSMPTTTTRDGNVIIDIGTSTATSLSSLASNASSPNANDVHTQSRVARAVLDESLRWQSCDGVMRLC